MSFHNTLRSALRGIAGNKLRAALTTLGIIIGVASVIATLALGNGARAAVEQNFRYLGSDGLQISTRQKLKDGKIVPVGKDLVYEDGLEMPGQVPLVNRVEMTIAGAGKVRYGRNVLDMSVTGTTADALLTFASANQLQPAGWKGGRVDFVIMRVVDVMSALPTLLFAYLIMARLGAGFWNVMLAIGITNMTYYWHLAFFPALMIALTMLGFTLMGDGLRDALDPQMVRVKK